MAVFPRVPLGEDDYLSHDACPTCAGSDLVAFASAEFNGTTLSYWRCRSCDLVFMNPVPGAPWYRRLYAEEFWETKSLKQSQSVVNRNTKQWRKALLRAEKYIDFLEKAGLEPAPGSRLLEVGCAYGLIVRTLADRWKGLAMGVEPSHAAREFAEHHCGVEIVAETMEDLEAWRPDMPVDMVMFSNALENIVDLNKALATIRRILAPGGLILIETANLTFRRSLHIYHPYCFSPPALSELFERQGFRVALRRTSGRPQTVLSNSLLMLVARRSEHAPEARAPNPLPAPRSGLGLRFGPLWFALTKSIPIRYLDRIITLLSYPLGPDSCRRLAALEAVTKVPREPSDIRANNVSR